MSFQFVLLCLMALKGSMARCFHAWQADTLQRRRQDAGQGLEQPSFDMKFEVDLSDFMNVRFVVIAVPWPL